MTPLPAWRWAANLALSNDNLPAAESLVPESRLDPDDHHFADDDGRTFSASFDLALTNDRTGLQVVMSSAYEMLTEDGAQENPSRDRRADVLTNVVQLHRRFDLDARANFVVGMGLGAQTVGNMNGTALQEWFHRDGGLGGRLLENGLQNDYGRMRSTLTFPIATFGGRLGFETGRSETWHAQGSVGATGQLAMGAIGLSTGQVDLGGLAGHGKIADVFASVLFSGSRTRDHYLRFAPLSHGMLGCELGISIGLLQNLGLPLRPYVTWQNNVAGFAETTYMIGFFVGRGPLSWLKAPR